MKIRILGNVRYNGNDLEKHEVYDIDEVAAEQLVTDGTAEKVKEDYPHVNKVKDKKRGEVPGQLVDAHDETKGKVAGVEPKEDKTVKGADVKPKEKKRSWQ